MQHALFNLACRIAGVLVLLGCTLAAAAPLTTTRAYDAAIGTHAEFFQEPSGRLTVTEAIAAYEAGRFVPARNAVLSFGIGARPVWIRLAVENPELAAVVRRLSIEAAWLDRIDVYMLHAGAQVATGHTGDRHPFTQRALTSRHFLFDHAFSPGLSEVFVRVETPDSMVVPMYFESREASRRRQMQQQLSYGFVYGFLSALIAYNLMLYASLRRPSYLLYALYLAAFMAMNAAYTGHGFAMLWPASVNWQRWAIPILTVLYGMAGLSFATRFLDLRSAFPRIYRGVLAFAAAGPVLLAAPILLGSQRYALVAAFGFISLFVLVMPMLGLRAVRAGQKPARYFLAGAGAAMAGAALTTLSIWGFVPHNAWTFRAVEIGMLVDATLLALALAYRFRVNQEQRLRAERLAQIDPLTGLNNRRAFYELTAPLWSNALRHGQALSVVLLDLDHFKRLNDTYGHAHGDVVLKTVADTLKQGVRQGDVLARWGGEEFIVLLPETDGVEATALAERLRTAIASLRVMRADVATPITASFGVAPLDMDGRSLDALIALADGSLFRAKQAGRNCVVCCRPELRPATDHLKETGDR